MNQLKVKIYKKSDDKFNGEHPNNINEGAERIGIAVFGKPVVDRSFRVFHSDTRIFTTSRVTEIVSDTSQGGEFKTLNSTYVWEVVE
jgi:hypothetical protein